MGITLLPTVLDNCSNPQKTQQAFESAMKKKFLVLGFVLLWVMS